MRGWFNKLQVKLRPYLVRVDKLTDKITSYRLVLYFLGVVTAWATLLSLFGQGPFKWYQILGSTALLLAVCRISNLLMARQFNVAANSESDLITALILALILSPPTTIKQAVIVAIAGLIAMASKYVFNIGRKHIFNPAAVAAATAALVFNYAPSWWIGMELTAPLLFVGGFLIARKIKRLGMVGLFLAIYLVLTFLQLILDAPLDSTLNSIWAGLTVSPLLFFAGVMLTEPITSPRQRNLYLGYSALVAALYSLTGLEIRPEQALLIGNLAAFVTDPNPRRVLKFVKKSDEADSITSFVFEGKKGLNFSAGQYMEWTLPQHKSDSRGNRRFMTISSSPTESEVTFAVKVPENMSSFKAGLLKLHPGDKILAGQLSGEFMMPRSEKTKMVWLAGGIGVTPFRSMAKYMKDFDQERDVDLIYFANSPTEFAFHDIFNGAKEAGLKIHLSLSTDSAAVKWTGLRGRLSKKMLLETVPDYKERTYYISGPYGFVSSSEELLLNLGINPKMIKVDYFPGYS